MNDNLTNRELTVKTSALQNLTKQQWSTLSKHIEETQEPALSKIFETLSNNQAQIEIIKSDKRYYDDIKSFILDNWSYWFETEYETENWLSRHLIV